ncbi:MAG: hypothetical protein OJJ54_01495 [Pseudonocardia sp.]|nr:hypothetical protein [Pseudonocardia sp.]
MPLLQILHLGGAVLVLVVGVMLLAVGSFVLGGVLTGGGGLWLGWSLRRVEGD